MSTAPIEAVIFDVAGVIVDWRGQRAVAGLYPDDEVEAFFAPGTPWAVINHRTDADWSLAQAQAEFDAKHPDLAQRYREYVERFELTVTGPIPGTSEFIRKLLTCGVPVFGLSNWAAANFSVARAAAPVIDELKDVIVSGDVGLAKPDPAIYQLALDRFGLEPATTAFVDDTALNLTAAAPLGLQCFHFTSADDLRAELTPRLAQRG